MLDSKAGVFGWLSASNGDAFRGRQNRLYGTFFGGQVITLILYRLLQGIVEPLRGGVAV